MTVQVKASTAIESLATDNTENQAQFRELEAPKHLIKLLKVLLDLKYMKYTITITANLQINRFQNQQVLLQNLLW